MSARKFVVHFAAVPSLRGPRIACDAYRDGVPATDYSFMARSVTCGRCRRTRVYREEIASEAEVDRLITDLNRVPTIDASEIVWEAVGASLDVAPEAWLKAHIVICGVDMHLEAIWVVIEDDRQVAVCPNLDEILNDYAAGAGADGHFEVMEREGLTYALFASPYC